MPAIFHALGLVFLLPLTGCVHRPSRSEPPRVIVAPESTAARARDSAIAAHVAQARVDNAALLPDSAAARATAANLAAASAALPVPAPDDSAAAGELSRAVLGGTEAQATTATATATRRVATLAQTAAHEREARALDLQKTLHDYDTALAAAQAEAQRQAQLRITSIFALLGAAVTILGIVSALTGWSRVGIALIPAGVALGGSGLLWGKPWFLYTTGGALALCCVACGILWAVSVSRKRGEEL